MKIGEEIKEKESLEKTLNTYTVHIAYANLAAGNVIDLDIHRNGDGEIEIGLSKSEDSSSRVHVTGAADNKDVDKDELENDEKQESLFTDTVSSPDDDN